MTHQQTNDAPPIDVPLLVEQCMDDARLALTILTKFGEEAPTNVDNMRRCLAQGDFQRVAKLAHAMRGTAGAVAALQTAAAALQLEQFALNSQFAEAERLVDTLHLEIRRCLGRIPEICESLQQQAE